MFWAIIGLIIIIIIIIIFEDKIFSLPDGNTLHNLSI